MNIGLLPPSDSLAPAVMILVLFAIAWLWWTWRCRPPGSGSPDYELDRRFRRIWRLMYLPIPPLGALAFLLHYVQVDQMLVLVAALVACTVGAAVHIAFSILLFRPWGAWFQRQMRKGAWSWEANRFLLVGGAVAVAVHLIYFASAFLKLIVEAW